MIQSNTRYCIVLDVYLVPNTQNTHPLELPRRDFISPQFLNNMALPKFIRDGLCPLLLILGCPLLIVIFNYIIQELHGDIPTTINEVNTYGPYRFIVERCVLNNMPTLNHFLIIFAFYMLQIVLYYIVPGAPAHGPATPVCHSAFCTRLFFFVIIRIDNVSESDWICSKI